MNSDLLPATHVHVHAGNQKIGMLLQAQNDLGLDLKRSILIGDKLSDIEAGRNACVARAVLGESGHPISEVDRRRADLVTRNLQTAATEIAALESL